MLLPKGNSSKGAPFQSPLATTIAGYINPPVAKLPRPPSIHPDPYDDGGSQDSFAGPISQDPEKQFLATTRLFDVPLSELGKATTQDATTSEMFAHNISSFGTLGQNGDQGRILVAATPSQSGSSQSPSMASQHSQDQDTLYSGQPVHLGGNPSSFHLGMIRTQNTSEDDISLPSSSYERLLAGEPDPTQNETLPADFQATQPADFQATQPSDSADAQADEQTDEDAENPGGAWISPVLPAVSHGTTATIGNPRGILSMVDPRKKWRLQGLAQQMVGNQDRARSGGKPSSALAETQKMGHFMPSNPNDVVPETPGCNKDDEEAETQPVECAAANEKPRQLEPGSHAEPFRGRYRRVLPPGHEDPMDIVPDSDPPQPSSSHRSPTKRKFTKITLSEEEDSGEIVPDSLEDETGNAGVDGNDDEQNINQDEDDEEEVPLAALTKRGKGDGHRKLVAQYKEKGKGKAKMDMAPPEPVAKVSSSVSFCSSFRQTILQGRNTRDAKSGPSVNDKGKQGPGTDTTARVTRGRGNATKKKRGALGTGEVPSSVPDQDSAYVGRATRRRAATKGQTIRRNGPVSTVPRTAKKRRVVSGSDDELRLKTDEEGLVPGFDEEEGTEPAEERYVDEDIKPNAAGPSTRKRKRATTRTLPNVTSRASTMASTPGSGRHQSVQSTGHVSFASPTRVFALWKTDTHYYVGTISHLVSGNRYLVDFEDGTNEVVELSNMRRCELMVGDSVILSQGDQRAKVAAVDGEYFRIPGESDDELGDMDYRASDIRIAPRSISAQWSKRVLYQRDIVTTEGYNAQWNHPTNTKALTGIGLFISITAGTGNWRDIKTNMKNIIRRHGGTVIEDFLDVVSIPGRLTDGGERWVGKRKNISWTGQPQIKRIFLLSDDANEKSKYLISLALGIPCLYQGWLRSAIAHDLSKASSRLTS